MDGLVFTGSGNAELHKFDVPAPGPSEVLIRVRASGLCGSDFHSYDSPEGLRRSDGSLIIAGHEPAGVIEEVGALVEGYVRGDRVLAHHILGCGHCRSCLRGYPVSCSSTSRAAYGGQRNGGHGEFLVVESSSVIRLPDNVSFIDGAMVACGFSTAYSALRRSLVTAGNVVMVTGLGPVGTSVAMIAQSMGAIVIGVDLDEVRAKTSTRFGVTHAIATSDEAVVLGSIDEITRGQGVDVAIDCTGSDSARRLCLIAAAVWGQVTFVGFGGGALSIDVPEMMIMKQLTVRGSWVSSLWESAEAVGLISRADVHPDRMVTATYSLDSGVAAYKDFKAGAPGKLVIIS